MVGASLLALAIPAPVALEPEPDVQAASRIEPDRTPPKPAASGPAPKPAEPQPRKATPSQPPKPKVCPDDMVLVEGAYCTEVKHDCVEWLDDEKLPFARCRRYSAQSTCTGKHEPKRFCIDRFEHSDDATTRLPLNQQSFAKANKVCKAMGKRLCSESEWNFACEGEQMSPYPYGRERKPVCNQDREDLYEKNPKRRILRDLRWPNQANDCVSPFGVYNMVGNLDEPTLREGRQHAHPFRNALKGGWWMAGRNRCRPATTAHDEYYKDIQIGVRCCRAADPEPH